MVVCQYFQRGFCRFGSSCRFEHTNTNYDSFYNTTATDQYQNNHQGDRYHYIKPTAASTHLPKNNQIDASQIFEIVAGDTVIAINGGQWPFSSYAPIKGYQNIIGFEDISPEELRYLMYNAKDSGNVEECTRHFNELLQIENIKRTLLMTPSAEADAAIQSIYRNEDQQSLNPVSSGAFQSNQISHSQSPASSHSASIFGGNATAVPATTLFAASANAPSIFGGNTSPAPAPTPFVTGNSTSVFGGGNSPSVFGGGNSSSIFGGSSVPAQTTSNVFGGAPSGLFSAAAAAVSQQTSGGFFGSTAVQPPSGLFAAAVSNRAFGEPVAGGSSSVFGGSIVTQPTSFGATTHTASIFGSGQQSSTPSQPFGSFQSNSEPFNQPNLPASLFQQGGEVNGSVYSLLSDLTDDEKAAFQAKTFTIGKIPIRPPPRELCV